MKLTILIIASAMTVPECPTHLVKPYPGDVNNDGVRDKKDLAEARQDSREWQNARNWQGAKPEVLRDKIAYKILIGDMNRDGILDEDDQQTAVDLIEPEILADYLTDAKNKVWATRHQDTNNDGMFDLADILKITALIMDDDLELPISKPFGEWNPDNNTITPPKHGIPEPPALSSVLLCFFIIFFFFRQKRRVR